MTLLFSETYSSLPPTTDINNSWRQNALPGGPNVKENEDEKGDT